MEGGCNFVGRKEREKEGLKGKNIEIERKVISLTL